VETPSNIGLVIGAAGCGIAARSAVVISTKFNQSCLSQVLTQSKVFTAFLGEIIEGPPKNVICSDIKTFIRSVSLISELFAGIINKYLFDIVFLFYLCNMKNINIGSLKVTNEFKDKLKFVSILSNLSNGINPSIEEDKFIDEQLSKLKLLEINTDYELKFDF
jgi:hypothetical protein